MASPTSGSLAGQVALVTGASRGIGRAIAVELARAGAAVVINHCASPDEAARVATALERQGAQSLVVQADVAEPGDVRRLYNAVVAAFGRVDILVNNAGITPSRGLNDFLNTTAAEFDRVIAVNVRGVFLCSQAVLPGMIERRHGVIILISSGAGLHGGFGDAPNVTYATSKAAEIGFTYALAKNVSRYGIRVNCVAPGPIDTSTLDSCTAPRADSRTLLGRAGYPHEVAAAVRFLCSPEASFITGQVLCVNGGNFLH